MQSIPIILATPDMVLAREVRRSDNPTAPPVCGSGVVLTESLLERLKTMGIKTLTVEGHPISMEGEMGIEEHLQDLERRFSKVSNDPLMIKLMNMHRKKLFESWGVDER